MERCSSRNCSEFGYIRQVSNELKECIDNGDDVTRARQLVHDLSREQRKTVANRRLILTDGTRTTLLSRAVKCQQIPFIRFLLEECYADTEQSADISLQMTPLCELCQAETDEFELVRILVEYHADVTAACRHQRTPVYYACVSGNLRLVEFLVQHGADINIPDIDGQTCLMRAMNVQDSFSHKSAGLPFQDICLFLVEHGACVNAVDNSRNSALHYAVSSSHDTQVIVEALLQHGADPTTKNLSGDDVLRAAALYHNTVILDYLRTQLRPAPQRIADLYSLVNAAKRIHYPLL